MTYYLGVNDDLRLTSAGRDVVKKDFLLRSEYDHGGGDSQPLPPHLAGTRAKPWMAPVYNPGAPAVALIRGMIAAVTHAGVGAEIVVLGDSKAEGYNAGGAGVRWRYGWVGLLREMLAAVEGFVLAYPNGIDARWVTNMVQGSSAVPGLIRGSESATATLTFDTPHTGGSFFVNVPAGGTVWVAVDGGSAQPFTVQSGNGFKQITPTVTGTGTHTYVVSSTASAISLLGFRPTYSGVKLKITNLGRSGATAQGWLPGASATQTGHWDAFTAATTPDAVIGALGTNQPGTSAQNAADLTAFWEAVAALGKPAIITTPGGLDITSARTEQYRAQLVAADTHNLPMIDFVSVIGDGPAATARGLMYDATHENRQGFAYEAATVAAALGVLPSRL